MGTPDAAGVAQRVWMRANSRLRDGLVEGLFAPAHKSDRVEGDEVGQVPHERIPAIRER